MVPVVGLPSSDSTDQHIHHHAVAVAAAVDGHCSQLNLYHQQHPHCQQHHCSRPSCGSTSTNTHTHLTALCPGLLSSCLQLELVS